MRSTRSKLATAAALLLLAGCSSDGIVDPGDEARRYTEYQCPDTSCTQPPPPSGGIATHEYWSEINVVPDYYYINNVPQDGKAYTFWAYSRGNEFMQRSKVTMTIESQGNCTGTWYHEGYRENQVFHYGRARTVEVHWLSRVFPLYVKQGWRLTSGHNFTAMPGSTGGGYFERRTQLCG